MDTVALIMQPVAWHTLEPDGIILRDCVVVRRWNVNATRAHDSGALAALHNRSTILAQDTELGRSLHEFKS